MVLCSLLVLWSASARAQLICPQNIGFENGTFLNWVPSSGNVATDGTMSFFPGAAMWNQHTIIPATNQTLDPYGNFPIMCPNGSGYSIRLGNDQTGAECERVSYTFTIPANVDKYSIIFNYAVVLENPNHLAFEQPRFKAEIFDVATNSYVDCASFEFVAASNLPGFEPSPTRNGVFFKPWSPVLINLGTYAGKTIRLDFTTNDCSKGGHFGYAYIDVDQDCTSPIKGNVYCAGDSTITLVAPSGFQSYAWYNSTFTQLLGTTNSLSFDPAPPNGTEFALIAFPFPGQGCLDTLYTTINSSPELLTLNVVDTAKGCINPGVDITLPYVVAGSTAGLSYNYFIDSLGIVYPPGGPKFIKTSGTYYISASNTVGCRDIKPVYVQVAQAPSFTVEDTVFGCSLGADLTNPALILTADPGLTYSFLSDTISNTPVPVPSGITSPGTYFIRGENIGGCSIAKPVLVTITSMRTVNQSNCYSVNLTSPSVTAGSSPGYSFTYWLDNAATQPLVNPSAVASSGTYFIRGANTSGCNDILPVQVTINPSPVFTVTDPAPVNYPATVNLFSTIGNSSGLNFSFWLDSAGTQAVPSPQSINRAGVYYARARNSFGCISVKRINVNVIPPPPFKVEAPNAFSPNGDGVNDVFKLKITGIIKVNQLRVFNRWGQEVFLARTPEPYWDGRSAGKDLPFGTYYWLLEGEDMYLGKPVTAQGSISIIR